MESPSESSAIRDLITVIMLKREIKNDQNPSGLASSVLSSAWQKATETTLQKALQRLVKDDVTAQQLSSLSDEDEDGDGSDGEPLATGSSAQNQSDMSEEELQYMFNFLDI